MRLTTALVFSAIGIGSGGGYDGALAADVSALSAIEAVTVFPSGAEVTRRAKVKLAGGEQKVVFADLPAQAIPGSIRVEGRSSGLFEIGSVDTRRLSVARSETPATDADRRALEDQLQALRDTQALFEGQVQAADAQRKLLTNLTEIPKVPVSATGTQPPVDWKAILQTIGTGLIDAKRNELEARLQVRETQRRIHDLEGKLAALAPSREQRTEVSVFVKADQALDADLVVRYQVPSASWTPFYDARLETGSKAAAPKLELTRRATIAQNTGEAWTNVALVLSTTRPTVGASAPDLSTMTVDYVPDVVAAAPVAAPPPVPRAMMKARAAADMSEHAVAGSVARDEVAVFEAQSRNAELTQAPFQALFTVPGRVDVAPTGEAKRVQLMADTIEPSLLVRTVPKLDAKAYLYAKLQLPKSSAILPGDVSLFRDGTFVGTGRLPLLAPGEEHELGFGTDDAVRVKHAIAEDKRGEKGLISSSKTDTRNFKITVKNLHERAIPVTVFDHMPVSQQQDIKVTLTGRQHPTRQDVDDKRGVVAWDLKLDPDQEQTIEFGYQVVWPGAKSITYR